MRAPGTTSPPICRYRSRNRMAFDADRRRCKWPVASRLEKDSGNSTSTRHVARAPAEPGRTPRSRLGDVSPRCQPRSLIVPATGRGRRRPPFIARGRCHLRLASEIARRRWPSCRVTNKTGRTRRAARRPRASLNADPDIDDSMRFGRAVQHRRRGRVHHLDDSASTPRRVRPCSSALLQRHVSSYDIDAGAGVGDGGPTAATDHPLQAQAPRYVSEPVGCVTTDERRRTSSSVFAQRRCRTDQGSRRA